MLRTEHQKGRVSLGWVPVTAQDYHLTRARRRWAVARRSESFVRMGDLGLSACDGRALGE